MLTLYDSLPDGLLQRDATRLHEVLPGPSLIHLPGKRQQPLFISLLLHGNEVTGWQAMQTILTKYQRAELPRSIYLLSVMSLQHGRGCDIWRASLTITVSGRGKATVRRR